MPVLAPPYLLAYHYLTPYSYLNPQPVFGLTAQDTDTQCLMASDYTFHDPFTSLSYLLPILCTQALRVQPNITFFVSLLSPLRLSPCNSTFTTPCLYHDSDNLNLKLQPLSRPCDTSSRTRAHRPHSPPLPHFQPKFSSPSASSFFNQPFMKLTQTAR